MFRGVNDSAGKCIFNLLKTFNLHERKSIIKRVTIIKMRVYEGSGDSSTVKSVTGTTEVMNMVMAVLGRKEICLEKDKLESKINLRFLGDEVVAMGCVEGRESDGLMI